MVLKYYDHEWEGENQTHLNLGVFIFIFEAGKNINTFPFSIRTIQPNFLFT